MTVICAVLVVVLDAVLEVVLALGVELVLVLVAGVLLVLGVGVGVGVTAVVVMPFIVPPSPLFRCTTNTVGPSAGKSAMNEQSHAPMPCSHNKMCTYRHSVFMLGQRV